MIKEPIALVSLLLMLSGSLQAAGPLQQEQESHSGASETCNFAANATIGNFVAVIAAGANGTGSGVSSISGLGNSNWTIYATQVNGSNVVTIAGTIVTSAATGVTVNFTGAPSGSFCTLSEWQGYTATIDGTALTSTAEDPGSYATSNANGSLILGECATLGSPPTAPSSPWNSLTSGSSFVVPIFQQVGVAGSYHPVWTGGSGTTSTVVVAVGAIGARSTGLLLP